MRSVRRTISLFTGVGGLDLGVEAAGFDVAVAVECDPDAVDAIRKNRRWWPIPEDCGHPLPIEAIDSPSLLRIAQLHVGEAALLVGGPPCQPFSKSGYWASGDTRRLSDPRASTLGHYFRVLRKTLPRTFLLENVLGLSYAGKSEGLDLIRREIAAINEEAGTRYSNFLLKLSKNQPSWTIQAQPGPSTGPFHWRNRRLSAEELGRLQTFPDALDYGQCKRAEIQRLIGNAVPSALAEVLAREIRV